MKQHYASFLLLLLPFFSLSQIRLNEGSNANGVTVVDADGSTSDWLELYNAGSTLNLQGYGLSDDPAVPMKWTFPDQTFPAGGYLVVLASGEGTLPVANHYETAVQYSDTWKYFIPSANVPGWETTGFNDGSWTTGALGIGYGDGDDITAIANPTTTVYVRRTFTIADTGAIVSAYFDVDFDDGFVAYLNGVEIARSGLAGMPPNWDDLSADHEAALYQGGQPQSFEIAPSVLQAALLNGTNVLAIEVHNSNPGSSDLSLIPFLTFGFDNATVYYGGTTHAWFSPTGGSNYIQTNFSIKAAGETVYLSDPSGTVLDSLAIPDLEPDMSYGKQTDGAAAHFYFDVPTPGASNDASVPYVAEENTPIIQFSGGLYPGAVTVNVQNQSTSGGVLRYTLDGQTPTMASNAYTGPLNLSSDAVLKVRCFSTGGSLLPSQVATETYIFMEDFTLPVLAISIDNVNLYGPTGIFDNYTTDWRKPCVIEYFNANGQKQFASRASIKPDGGAGGSRSNPQHSVTIEPAHGLYGTGEPVTYPLIPEKGFITEYYAFYLRNGSNYWNAYPQKDATFMRMMRETNVNSQAYTPVVAYLNGQYFGVYEIREKANEHYFETNYDNDPDSLDLLSVSYFYGPGVLRTVKGSDTGFYAMQNLVTTYSPAAPDYFDVCNERLDLYNFTDYLAGENWFANYDWVYNNMKIARMRTVDNKWRFYLQDMELGLGGWSDYNANMFDYFRYNNQPNPYWPIYDALSQNTAFRNYFVNRYADLMNTVFQPSFYGSVVNDMYTQLLPEMPRHHQLWTGDPIGGMATYTAIYNDLVTNQFPNRNNVVRNQIVNEFGLNEPVDVTLDVSPAGAGYIKISTIVPDGLPWTGVYFDGVPVQITAVANPGYTFTGWQPNGIIPAGDLNTISITLNIPDDGNFTALFGGTPQPLSLTISEVNYNTDSTLNGGDWIELHNYGTTPLSLDNWKINTSEHWEEYILPMHTTIPPGGYLVVCEDTSLFRSVYPEVTNFIGPTSAGLGNGSDFIRISNAFGGALLDLIYTDSVPFPECADGWGRTLENRFTDDFVPDSSAWFCGCVKGSPGTAYFPCDDPIVFSEINYNNIDAEYNAGDWVELKNNSAAPISLNGYTFRDKKDEHLYTLPDVTLPAGGYWVLSGDPLLFAGRHNDVANFSGTFDFGLSGSDVLRLYDASGVLVMSVLYNNTDPWPLLPSTEDYTLEYSMEAGYRDPNDGTSWFAGCEGGSPGRGFTPCPVLGDDQFVNLYPNPTSGDLNIVFDNSANSSQITGIQLFDLNGNIVREMQVQAVESVVGQKVDVSDLRHGVYYVRVMQSGRMEQLPFVKL